MVDDCDHGPAVKSQTLEPAQHYCHIADFILVRLVGEGTAEGIDSDKSMVSFFHHPLQSRQTVSVKGGPLSIKDGCAIGRP